MNDNMDTGNSIKGKSVEDLKKEIYDALMDTILDAILNGRATMKDGKQSAQFMLDKLDVVQNKDGLLQFLFDISTKWALYNPYYIKMKYGFEVERDDKKIQELKSKLYSFIQPK